MAPSTCAAAAQAALDEELRVVCAKAFTHYENGHPRWGEKLLLKHLTRHPRHPLLHYALVRLAHMPALELQQPADDIAIQRSLRSCSSRQTTSRFSDLYSAGSSHMRR
jgi:hypothetical protein